MSSRNIINRLLLDLDPLHLSLGSSAVTSLSRLMPPLGCYSRPSSTEIKKLFDRSRPIYLSRGWFVVTNTSRGINWDVTIDWSPNWDNSIEVKQQVINYISRIPSLKLSHRKWVPDRKSSTTLPVGFSCPWYEENRSRSNTDNIRFY